MTFVCKADGLGVYQLGLGRSDWGVAQRAGDGLPRRFLLKCIVVDERPGVVAEPELCDGSGVFHPACPVGQLPKFDDLDGLELQDLGEIGFVECSDLGVTFGDRAANAGVVDVEFGDVDRISHIGNL